MKITKEEQRIFKTSGAMPYSVIEKRRDEILDELLICKDEDMKWMRKFVLELTKWLKTVNVFKKPTKRLKKDNSI